MAGAAKGKLNGKAKSGDDEIFGKGRTSVRYFAPAMAALRARFPRKTAHELAYRANRSERICEDWVAGKGSPDGEALTQLLCSDVGDLVWLALTREAREPKIKHLRKAFEVALLEERRRELDRQIAELRGA